MFSLILSGSYPTKKCPMNGIFAFDQAKALKKNGCKVVFAAIDLRSVRRLRPWGFEQLQLHGIDVRAINIPLGRIPRPFWRLARRIGGQMLFHKIVKEFGLPDILHAHFTELGLAGGSLKAKFAVPLVVTEHSSLMAENFIPQWLTKTAKRAYSQADELIAVSPALAKIISKEFGYGATYIPNVVDTDTFVCRPKMPGDSFSFLSVGNLIPRKGMDLTINAFNRVLQEFPHATLKIIGDGPERPKLESLIKKHGLGEKVKLLGLCRREVIANHLSQSDCFVLASRAETFGVVYAEALATGTPVIATRCQGPEGFVNEKNGLLVPVGDVDELSLAMKHMMNRYTTYDNRAIAASTVEAFSASGVAKKIMAIYENCINMRMV